MLSSSQFGAKDRLHKTIKILRHLIVDVKTRLLSILKLLLVDVSVGVANDRRHNVVGGVE